jgi:hypothetical protein
MSSQLRAEMQGMSNQLRTEMQEMGSQLRKDERNGWKTRRKMD